MINKIKSKINKKRSEDFENALKEAYSFIKFKRFDMAVGSYHHLEKQFKLLPKYKKTRKLHQDILVLYKEISLYLRVNEAYISAKEGNLEELKKELDNITDLSKEVEDLPGSEALLEYTKKHYKFCLDVYTYKTTSKNFEYLYKTAEDAIDMNDISSAVKFYSQLLIVYNNLLKYEDYNKRIEIYYKIKDLYRNLEFHEKIDKAYKLKTPKLLNPDKKDMPLRTFPEKYNDSKETYIKIRNALANGDYSKASEIYKKL